MAFNSLESVKTFRTGEAIIKSMFCVSLSTGFLITRRSIVVPLEVIFWSVRSKSKWSRWRNHFINFIRCPLWDPEHECRIGWGDSVQTSELFRATVTDTSSHHIAQALCSTKESQLKAEVSDLKDLQRMD